MTFATQIVLLDPAEITIPRAGRQRQQIDVSDLLQSIKKNGVINPAIVTRELVLVAGERRLESCRQLGIALPCRFAEDLSPSELQIIELEENLKRSDLVWQDQARAIGRIHELYRTSDPGWTLGETAEKLSLTIGNVSLMLMVYRELEREGSKIASAGTAREAYNVIKRAEQRKLGNELEELLGSGPVGEEIVQQVAAAAQSGVELPKVPARPVVSAPPAPDECILEQSFLDWAPSYRDEPFNLIHCDFPYGANVFGGKQGAGSMTTGEQYSDDKETYFELLDCFCKNFDNFASFSCHVVFWFSFRHYAATLQMFRNYVPSLEFTLHPLIWGKSDNVGVISDSRRDPRHTYEMALLGRRGGRMVVKSAADLYNAPTDRSTHASVKPEPMLRHFFGMLCDEHSSLLDPTCGSGSALRAAESLGAKRTLGLEINPEHAAMARQLLRNARVLKRANEVGGAEN